MRLGRAVIAGIAFTAAFAARAGGMAFQGEFFPIDSDIPPYVADFDGDSIPDVAFAVSAQSVPILRTRPDGTVESWGSTNRGGRWLIGAGDFDGNGRGDLAFLGDGALELRPGRGDGTFDEGRLLPFAERAYFWTQGRTGDLDGDGYDDLVFPGEAADSLHVVYGGEAGFAELVTLSGVETSQGYGVADLTGGGRSSIVVMRFGAVDAYEAGLERELGPPTSTSIGGSWFLRALVDLTGDGRRDLLLEEAYVWPSRLRLARGETGATFGEPEELEGPGAPGCFPITGDWDVDGDVDWGCSGYDDRTTFWSNDGRGGFTPWHTYALPEGYYGFTPLPGWPEAPILLGEVFNPSGHGYGVVVHPPAPAGRSALPVGMTTPFSRFPDRGSFFVQDIDEDGDLDWIAFDDSRFFVRNDGSGRPAGPAEPLATQGLVGTVGDFDGDGRVDLVYAASDGSGRFLFEKGNGDATFQPPTEAFVAPQRWSGRPFPLDADDDGRLDVVETSLWGGLNVWRGRGDGTFDGPIVAYPPSAPIDGNVVAGDFDGDGDRDLAGSSAFWGIVLMLRNDDGTYAPPAPIPDTYYSLGVASGDFDGDGDDDLARLAQRGYGPLDLEVLVADGHGEFEGGRSESMPGANSIYSADPDADGRDEIVLNLFGMTAFVAHGAGPEPWSIRRFPAPGQSVLADLDGDGLPDLSSWGPLQYMPWERPNGMGIFVLLNVSAPPNAPPVASAGDDQILQCTSYSGATATLDGRGSTDDGEIASWAWSSPATGDVSGEVVHATFPLGVHDVTLTVTDDGGLTGTDATQVVVRDTTAPSGSITFPEEETCHGPSSVPVVVADSFTDVCDPAIERTWTPSGPSIDAHGDHAIALDVRDASGNAASDTVAFTIDTTPPEVALASPGGGWVAGQLVGLSLFFTATDDDGAAGEVATERILLSGCVLFDGATYGDADGLLSDESIVLSPGLLCEAASRCGWTTLPEPELRVEAEDCAGNVGSASHRFAGSLAMRPGLCGRATLRRSDGS